MISRRRLILFHTIQQVIPNICTKFQNPRRSSSWEIFDTLSLCITLEWEMEKRKKMVKINLSNLFFCSTIYIYLAILKVYKKFEDWLSQKPRNLLQKIWLERKKNGQIKVMVRIRRLILSYTKLLVIHIICTKFQNPRCSCSWEIFDTNFPMYYIGKRDGKKQKW